MSVNELSSSVHTWILDDTGNNKVVVVVFVRTTKLYSNSCPNLDLYIKKLHQNYNKPKESLVCRGYEFTNISPSKFSICPRIARWCPLRFTLRTNNNILCFKNKLKLSVHIFALHWRSILSVKYTPCSMVLNPTVTEKILAVGRCYDFKAYLWS